MYPRLDIGPVSVINYTVLLVLGIVVGIIMAWRLAIAARLSGWRFSVLIVGAVFAGLLGSHWLHVCTLWSYYRDHPAEVLAFWDGRAFIGAPVTALLFIVVYTRWFGMPCWRVLDCLAPSLTIGHLFGRLGCCAAGCCHGYPTDTLFGVSFFTRAVEPAAWRGMPLHPTQLYEAAGLLVLFHGLLWLWRRRSVDGQVILAYALGYPVLRFGIEFLRGDAIRGFVAGWLSTSQFVALLIFAGALVTLILRNRWTRSERATARIVGPTVPNAVASQRQAA